MFHIRFQVEKKINIFEISLPFLSFWNFGSMNKLQRTDQSKDREQSKISYENQYHR